MQEAVDVYLEAVSKLPSHYAPQSLYNMLGTCTTTTTTTTVGVCFTGLFFRRSCQVRLVLYASSKEESLVIAGATLVGWLVDV